MRNSVTRHVQRSTAGTRPPLRCLSGLPLSPLCSSSFSSLYFVSAHTKPASKFALSCSPLLPLGSGDTTPSHGGVHNDAVTFCLLTGDLANGVRPFSKGKKVVKRWNPDTRAPTSIMSSQQSGQALGMSLQDPPQTRVLLQGIMTSAQCH